MFSAMTFAFQIGMSASFSSSALAQESGVIESSTNSTSEKSTDNNESLDKTSDKKQQVEPVEEVDVEVEVTESPAEKLEVVSITEDIKQGQIRHEKDLVDKFLFGIAVIFFVIAFLLFNSLPPSSPEQGSS